MKIYSVLLGLFLSFTSSAQYQGDKWVIGYYSLGSPDYSIMHLDFRGDRMNIEWHFEETMHMRETGSNICNESGEPVVWTNGMEVFYRESNKTRRDTIALLHDPAQYWEYYDSDNYGPFGFPEHNGSIILPVPGTENEFSIIYHHAGIHPGLYFAVKVFLESRAILGSDSVIILHKDKVIGKINEWYKGTINAIKHANGRDWWLVAFDADLPIYYTYILDPDGLRFDHEGTIAMTLKEGLGQAAFSGQGNFFARMDAITLDEGQYISLFQANRCSGDYELLDTFHTAAGYFTGVAFSPFEQYLYADDNTHLWQWDLHASDIASSRVLVDTFDGFVQPGWTVMRFGPIATAPDGRIYVVPPAGSSEFIHVIERPNLPGKECRFLQHSINLTKPNGRSAPNIPNYRLGPLDGSPCDTLGLNNHPVARFRFEHDQPGDEQHIRFTDLSYYDPREWHWDFDDGHTSSIPEPVHFFEPGLYHVCLTVSNDYSQDSMCRWVEVFTTDVIEIKNEEPDLSIHPNPFSDHIRIEAKSHNFRPADIRIWDMHGRLVFDKKGFPVPITLYLPPFPPGMYLCQVVEEDGRVNEEKLMKVE